MAKTDEQWVTWTRYSRSRNEVTSTRLASEPAPKYFSSSSRPATAEEIEAEKQYRAEKAAESATRQAIESRPEYAIAQEIRNRLEWITPESNPLDALTLEEWEALRGKLCGGEKR